jgi:hypothetical protein
LHEFIITRDILMQTILAARVETQQRADQLMATLAERGVAAGDMQVFYVNPPGQHAEFPVGGDQHADRGAQDAHKGQLSGAAIGAAAGLAAGGLAAAVLPPLAPAVLAGVTGVGALAGSVAGAVVASRTDEEAEPAAAEDPQPVARRGGLMLAVRVTPQSEAAVLDAMRAAGATDVERAVGEWRDGSWVDFDPLEPPHAVDRS